MDKIICVGHGKTGVLNFLTGVEIETYILKTETISNEQWLKGGNCNECRRVKYCSKPCKENGKYMNRKITESLNKTTVGNMIKQFNNILGEY